MTMTPMLKRYLIKFAVRLAVFFGTFFIYLTNHSNFVSIITSPVAFGIAPYHVFWACMMGVMLLHIFPIKSMSMAMLKRDEPNYVPQPNYNTEKLKAYMADKNRRALYVLLIWLGFNAIWAVLYLTGVIGLAEIIMLTTFYFLSDYICILIYCPFGYIVQNNKCCINCRIYDWGHFMMFTLLILVPNFFALTLFAMGLIVLLRWEYAVAKHPEFMWEGSNRVLQCRNCQDKTCQMKKKVTAQLPGFLHPYHKYPKIRRRPENVKD